MNTEDNEETAMEEDFQLPNHPLLSFQDDGFLSGVAKILRPEFDQHDLQESAEITKKLVFNSHEMSDLQKTPYCESSVCSKFINEDEMYYICFDCDINSHPNMHSLFCEECFDKSDHKGHRLFLMKGISGSANCDCGDAQALKPQGFCSDHQSKPVDIQELYENFPHDLRANFEILTKKSIYGAVSLFEIYQALGENISALVDYFVSKMLDFWIECYSEVNRAFLPILWTTLRSKFESPYDLVWHDCKDIKAENKNFQQESHRCTCSLLGNLLRISNLVNKENQGKLKKILIECVKDQDFRGYLALEFAKYTPYFFTQDYDKEISEEDEEDEDDDDDEEDATDCNSLVLGSYVHLYTEDDILNKVLDSGYFENFLHVMKKVVDGCTRINSVVAKSVKNSQNILDYFLLPRHKSGQRLAQDQNFMVQYLEILMTFQMKFYYHEKLTTDLFDHQINYEAINLSLRTERRLCRSFENYIKLIYELPLEEQKKVIARLLKNWYMNLETAKAALKGGEEEEDGRLYQSFNPCLERIFCCVVINYLKNDISTDNLQKFIKENFEDDGVNILNILEGPLRALGMARYLHLTFNYKSGEIFENYYDTEKAFFETDVVTTQMMILLLTPEKGLFESLVESFFSYSPEIIGFFQDPKEENYEKKLLTMIEDFLYFLVFLMTDEICLINLEAKYKKDNFGRMKLSPKQRSVVKNLVVNILKGLYWTTSKRVTKIYDNFLMTDQDIDQILLEVTVNDEKNHKIRIKDEYASDLLDPYIFYRMPAVRQDMVEAFTAKNSKKGGSIDLISSGGGLEKDAPKYLKDIQVRLFQSSLSEFLYKYLKMTDVKSGNTLIRLVLKLILLNLQVAENSPLLKQKVEKMYMNNDFLQILNNILSESEESLKDCINCVKKIKELLLRQQQQQKSQGDNMLVENSPRTLTDKKKLTAQERMEQLKQSFAQKQAAFAQKNELMFQKSTTFENSEESEQLVCQHCMEKLHASSSKEYGLPIHITFTNNFYNESDGKFIAQDYTNFLKTDWWPVVSSCNHYYHRKCFETFYKAPPQKDFESHFLSNAYEFLCPLCRGVCNNFLSINGEEKESDEMNQEAVLEEIEMYPQIYQTFPKKIQKLLVDLKARIQLGPTGHATALEEASFVSVEVIFERTYQYFIESFYLLDNIEKSFGLYLAFFKGFKGYITSLGNKVSEENLQLSTFFNVNNLFLSTQASSHQLNYKTEIYLIELLAKNLQRNLATTSHSDDVSGKSELLALKNFILLKVIQTIAFNNFGNATRNIEDCLLLYQSDENLRSMIFKQLTFPIKKIILAYAMNISAAASSSLNLAELFSLLQNPPISTLSQEEYLTELFRSIQIPYSFPEFIKEIFQELPIRPQSEIDFLSSLFDNSLFTPESLKPQLVKFSPRVFSLPEDFFGFNTKYYPEKCSLCKKHNADFRLSICLICGDILCTFYCNNDESQAGNLNRHSKKYHLGMGVFLDVQDMYQSLVNTPLNLNYEKKSLYVNTIGQDITSFFYDLPSDIAKLDFTDFKLNQEYLKELKEMINQQALRKNIVAVGLRIEEKVEDGFL